MSSNIDSSFQFAVASSDIIYGTIDVVFPDIEAAYVNDEDPHFGPYWIQPDTLLPPTHPEISSLRPGARIAFKLRANTVVSEILSHDEPTAKNVKYYIECAPVQTDDTYAVPQRSTDNVLHGAAPLHRALNL